MNISEAGMEVFSASRIEGRALRRGLRDTSVARTGVGLRRAKETAARIGAGGPLTVAGVGGAVVESLSPGDVVVASEVRGPDGRRYPCPASGLLVAALRRHGLRVYTGPIASVARPVAGRRARARLAQAGVLAVDMESAPLVAAAYAAKRPVAVLRVIADAPGHPLVSPRFFARGRAALRVLPVAAAALAEWSAAAGAREVTLASPRSFCAGVERAIDIVERALERFGAPVYVRKQIVHNSHVVADLRSRGAVFVEDLDEVPDGARVVFSAHGVAPAVWQAARQRHLSVVDATCPLVSKVHAEARRFSGRGDTVILIGHAGHEEVEGTLGEAPAIRLVANVAEARTVVIPDPDRVSYLMQTTLAADEAQEILGVLRERLPKMRGPASDDICYATTNRQQAVRAAAEDAEVVLVLGSPNSSNSQRLVEIGERAGCRSYLVEDDTEIDPRWLIGVRRVAVTAGASAPPDLVDRCVAALDALGGATVRECSVASESVSFGLPREVS